MLRGYYTAASGMMAQQRRQESLSNNIANAQTPGFKQDQTSIRAFPELLIKRMESNELSTANGFRAPKNKTIGSINTGVYLQETIPDYAQGGLKDTGIATDMALINGTLPDETGSIFFTVQNAAGEERYTRNGNFTVDGAGFLTTNQGYYVLDNDGNPIATGGQTFSVSSNGIIQVDGQEIPLAINYSPNANDMVKDDENLFAMSEDGAAMEDARATAGLSYTVQQKYLENSNVDAVQTMTDMMRAYRMFETNQKVLQAYDQSMDKAVNQIARLT
ncbi:flagellar hook-basal body complex protein FlhO [Paraliobacillus quinghaiensis]|uniref:Flagellar hook-basal body complex protein FlhO n=1 Tax=Paraliobacillus quinghaiensis TaxID=470815 RepID=A0A917TPS6_9BACI|nr:flagellar hook-basal body protein [Paraliobacillus quinghaiensis]GGM32431.1 flagellar hook-basal body complex protein FlhO [Paraliobacillus quinghaiensis]